MIVKLKYGNTNTFFIKGEHGGLLVDTDYAGTALKFYKALKECGIKLCDIDYVCATHYHPDHAGLIGELIKQGVKLLLFDVQVKSVHFSDKIFEKDKLPYEPIDPEKALVIPCDESRAFLKEIGISGEAVSTPSHSPDSISLILDSGECLAGDLEPLNYLAAYEKNIPLEKDWNRILEFHPKKILYGHANEKMFPVTDHLDRIHDVSNPSD